MRNRARTHGQCGVREMNTTTTDWILPRKTKRRMLNFEQFTQQGQRIKKTHLNPPLSLSPPFPPPFLPHPKKDWTAAWKRVRQQTQPSSAILRPRPSTTTQHGTRKTLDSNTAMAKTLPRHRNETGPGGSHNADAKRPCSSNTEVPTSSSSGQ